MKLQKGANNHRKNDSRLVRVFKCLLIFKIADAVVNLIVRIVRGQIFMSPYYVLIQIFSQLALIQLAIFYYGFKLFWNMYKLHRVEFEKSSKPMIQILVAYQLIFLFYCSKVVFISRCSDASEEKFEYENELMCSNFYYKYDLNYYFQIMIFTECPSLLISLLFLKVKKVYDPISAVSKLDGLYMMSIFQKSTATLMDNNIGERFEALANEGEQR